MKLLSPKNRIATGLTGAVIAVICLARVGGYIPDRTGLLSKSRSDLAETVALGSSSLIMSNDVQSLNSFLQGVASRNQDIQSFGVRTDEGELVAQVGDHLLWDRMEGDHSNASQIQVPIYQSQDEKWGTVEIRFTDQTSGLFGILQALSFGQMFFIGSSCFLLFNFILGMVLKHLDPSKAVPQRVRDALDNLAEGLLILDTKNNILLANTAFANVLGQSPEKLIGKRSESLGIQTHGDAPWSICLEEKRLVSNERVSLTDAAGKELNYLVNCSPLLGHKGNYCGVMVTFDDVTQLEESRLQLQEARDAANAANRAKSDFLANMSHEIRTPMNAILGFTDVLRRGMEENPHQRIEYLNTIHASGNHLIDLINDILDLSKVEAGKLDLELREFGLPEMLHQVTNVLSAKAQQKGLELSHYVKGEIPAYVYSDSTRIRQILINLLGNAIKFTEEGNVRLDCQYQEGTLRFDVTDTGIGMTAEQLERIFDPFSQADSSVTRRFGGTGLGLSICKKFAEALNGSISVQSSAGVGTVFTVQLPVRCDSAEWLDQDACVERIQNMSYLQFSNQNYRLNHAKILVVDDGQTNRDLCCVVLRRHGMTILEADNGQIACDLVRSEKPDLVLMDMQMPVMDGYTATGKLRADGIDVPIIALTGNAMKEDQQKCKDIGCDGFLAKPIDIDKLIETMGMFLGFSTEPLFAPVATTVETNSSELANQSAWSSTLPMDDPEFKRIVETFVGNLPGRLEGMFHLLCQQDMDGLKDEAHWLKGASGTVGLGKLTQPSLEIERAAGAHDVAKCKQHLQRVVELVATIEI